MPVATSELAREQRLAELAAVFACGILRLQKRAIAAPSLEPEFGPTWLDVSPTKSVTVRQVDATETPERSDDER